MKRILLLFICFMIILAPAADAAIGSKGLIILDGKQQIELQKGDQKWLYVKDGFTKMPLLKGICYYSDNTVVASIGLHSGILRANSVGTATITASNNKGDCGILKIRVTSVKKGNPLWILLFLPFLFFLLKLLFRR